MAASRVVQKSGRGDSDAKHRSAMLAAMTSFEVFDGAGGELWKRDGGRSDGAEDREKRLSLPA
jgi:hypothetical protein